MKSLFGYYSFEAKNLGDADRGSPFVYVGGSDGGLDAYTQLLWRLPAEMGVAIVIGNHLRIVATKLHEILTRYTKMLVELITDRFATAATSAPLLGRRPRGKLASW